MTITQTPPPATTVVNTIGASVTNTVAKHAETPKKFSGQNFKRWQQKMFFYLTTLGLARFLKKIVPQVEPLAEGQSSNTQILRITSTARPRLPKNYESRWNTSLRSAEVPRHRAANCKMPKRVNPRQANIVNDDVDMIAMVSDVCAIVSE
nr:putative EF-hand domain pair, reverse transcriptase, RNA-dependent DNA polymerase [Tanacetum cinerariifolium]